MTILCYLNHRRQRCTATITRFGFKKLKNYFIVPTQQNQIHNRYYYWTLQLQNKQSNNLLPLSSVFNKTLTPHQLVKWNLMLGGNNNNNMSNPSLSSSTLTSNKGKEKLSSSSTNRLANEKSPYLLVHYIFSLFFKCLYSSAIRLLLFTKVINCF